MGKVEKVDWFCPKCNSYVSAESVTHEETHQICNTRVILEPLNQNNDTKPNNSGISLESNILRNKIFMKYLIYFSYFVVFSSILALIYLIFAICYIK